MATVSKVTRGNIEGNQPYVEFSIRGHPRTKVVVQKCGRSKGKNVYCVFYVSSMRVRTLHSGFFKEAKAFALRYIGGMS